VIDVIATELRRDAEICTRAERGTWITFPCEQRVRPGDKVFVVRAAETAQYR